MTEVGLDFRATKDIDLVLIVEAVDVNFGKKFWEYVKKQDMSIEIEVQECHSFIALAIHLQINIL